MSDNLKDILSNEHPEIDQETMLLYLQGKLSPEQKHEVERILMQGDFEEDAMEGLQAFNDKEQIQYTVEALNRDLKKRTEKKQKRRDKLKLPDQSTTIIAIIILLLLVAFSYVLIVRMMNK
ncbi:MAG: hypothetical protein J0M10_02505 [Chitinophagales bacterium]|nr:hypothetical protein [Chitinophagales bacterium]